MDEIRISWDFRDTPESLCTQPAPLGRVYHGRESATSSCRISRNSNMPAAKRNRHVVL